MFTEQRWIAVADRIGRRLCSRALWTEGGCFWLGSPQEAGGNRSLASLGASLYSGSAGIGLFLAALARATDDRIVKDYASGALTFAARKAPMMEGAGLYSGRSGVALALMLAGEILADDMLIAQGSDILASLPHTPSAPDVDILDGIAGTLIVLDRATERGWFDGREHIASYAASLAAAGQTCDQGLFWPSHRPAMPPLLGYSHGVAGIAAGLYLAGTRLGDSRLLHAAEDAVRYENSAYSPTEGNWPDLRLVERGQGPQFMHGWCHGAPGILAGRLLMGGAGWDLEAAVRSTREASAQPGDYLNWSLCHGAAGNADLLLSAYTAGAPGASITEVEAVAEYGLLHLHDKDRDWPFGDELWYAQLMTGVAGVGYFYLRLASGGALPSVLTAR